MKTDTVNRPWAKFGSVSTDTNRTRDLFEAFLDEAKREHPNHEDVKSAAAMWQSWCDVLCTVDDGRTEQFSDLFWNSQQQAVAVDTLMDVLNEGLPPFVSFGVHPGDGADYGYWFDPESFEVSVHDGETLKVSDLPDDDTEIDPNVSYVAVVSDHGNVSLYFAGTLELIYSVV